MNNIILLAIMVLLAIPVAAVLKRTSERAIHMTIVILSIVMITASVTVYVSRNRTCATDNQAYHYVLKHWGKTNVIDLSRMLTRMQKDGCKEV